MPLFETYLFDHNDMHEDKRVSVKQIFIYMVSLETSGATLKVSDIAFLFYPLKINTQLQSRSNEGTKSSRARCVRVFT